MMKVWCDVCGDIVSAYIPIRVEFYERGAITINVCIQCWNSHFEGKSRKVKVAKLLSTLVRR